MLTVLQGMTFVAMVVWVWQHLQLWRAGRALAHTWSVSQEATHKARVTKVFWSSLALVVIVVCLEVTLYASNETYYVSEILGWSHVTAVAGWVLLFGLIYFRYDGRRRPDRHKVAVYIYLSLATYIALTGAWMIYQIPA